jgi:predicted DNA-binding transcriptional regulator AlpA
VTPETRTFTFTLLIEGPDLQDEDRLAALFEAGCDDATFGSRDSLQFADFDREASSLAEALRSAIRDIKSAVPEAHVVRVEPEEFVSLKAIADRVGFSKQYVQMLADGERGPGSFPSVVRWVDSKTRVWRWSDVADWVETRLGRPIAHAGDAHMVAVFNGLLEATHHVLRVEDGSAREELTEFIREDEEIRVLLDA